MLDTMVFLSVKRSPPGLREAKSAPTTQDDYPDIPMELAIMARRTSSLLMRTGLQRCHVRPRKAPKQPTKAERCLETYPRQNNEKSQDIEGTMSWDNTER